MGHALFRRRRFPRRHRPSCAKHGSVLRLPSPVHASAYPQSQWRPHPPDRRQSDCSVRPPPGPDFGRRFQCAVAPPPGPQRAAQCAVAPPPGLNALLSALLRLCQFFNALLSALLRLCQFFNALLSTLLRLCQILQRAAQYAVALRLNHERFP